MENPDLQISMDQKPLNRSTSNLIGLIRSGTSPHVQTLAVAYAGCLFGAVSRRRGTEDAVGGEVRGGEWGAPSPPETVTPFKTATLIVFDPLMCKSPDVLLRRAANMNHPTENQPTFNIKSRWPHITCTTNHQHSNSSCKCVTRRGFSTMYEFPVSIVRVAYGSDVL